jgi:N12 class adenine-specific DNA methylase
MNRSMRSLGPLRRGEGQNGERFTIKQMEKTRKSLEARLEKLQAEDRKDDVITFEQLGVDRLFVDEAMRLRTCFLHKNAECGRFVHIGSAEIFSDMLCQVPLYG